MKKYLEIAKYVREGIERNKNKLHTSIDSGFKNFPTACCDKSSEIMLKYLNDNSINDFNIICKEGNYLGYDYLHVWIENDNIVIDITANQFNGKIDGITFANIIVIKKEDFFFNKADGYYSKYNGNFMKPSKGFFNYLEFYNLYIKN